MSMTWDELYKACCACQQCELCNSRTNTVFGVGNRDSKILFIGEAPGEQEDLRGEPFVGRAGQLLDKMLASIGFDRNQVYIANILKCRPPNNRDPLPEERVACLPFLRQQTALLKPKIIVCVGRIAAVTLLDPDYKITKQHGTWTERAGIKMTAIYHPAALLRNPNLKPETYQDLLAIRAEYDKLS